MHFRNHVVFLLGCVTAMFGATPSSKVFEQAILVPPTDRTREDRAIVHWQGVVEANPTAEAFERLGWAFVAKARTTLDDGFYTLALLTTDAFAAKHGKVPGEELLRGHIFLNLHRFREAEKIARVLLSTEPRPLAYALLSDALLEQGRVDEAVAACQHFVAAQPGTEAYARVAHLRWLKGDLPGAITAMEAALKASSPRAGETYAWALVRLAHYELERGDANRAHALVQTALRVQPNFAPALLALGQALLALERPADALAPLTNAAEQSPLPTYQWWLADAQRAVGDIPAAEATEAALRRRGGRSDPRSLSLFLATRGRDAGQAVTLARRELDTRADVHTHDALAWALLSAGETSAAAEAMRHALATPTADPRMHLHAASVARATGDFGQARDHLSRAQAGAAALAPSERRRLAEETAALPPLSSS